MDEPDIQKIHKIFPDKISLKHAAKNYGYTQQHLGLLCRRGELKSMRIGKKWFTKIEWMEEYLKKVEEQYNSQENYFTVNKNSFDSPSSKSVSVSSYFLPKAAIVFSSLLIFFFFSQADASVLKSTAGQFINAYAKLIPAFSDLNSSFSAAAEKQAALLGADKNDIANIKNGFEKSIDAVSGYTKAASDGIANFPQNLEDVFVEFFDDENIFVYDQGNKDNNITGTASASDELKALRTEFALLKSQNSISVEQSVAEKTVEKIISGLSQKDLDLGLADLNSRILERIEAVRSELQRQAAGNQNTIALTNRISQISSPTIYTPTISAPSVSGTASLETLTTSGAATLKSLSVSTTASVGSDLSVGGIFSVSTTTATSTFAWGVQATSLNITSSTATSTFANGLDISDGCFAVDGVCVGGSSGGVGDSTAIGQIPYYAAVGSELSATSSLFINTNQYIGIGTTTPQWLTQLSGTRPTLALSDSSAGANLKHWLFSSMGGNLYIGTSTDSYGTSTPSALTILNSGYTGIGTTTP
ncbi:MAG: hypothetical protein PHC85_02505, partial [Candidatus Pacebacteria bacterium]|nr:hypothetical protein [Candidatus Paceibacterota bacterium]